MIANTTRKPLWGYRAMVGAALFMGFMSFLVWAHHMFLTGMGPTMSAFFQVTTMIISIPSVIIVSSLLLSLYGGSIRFTVPALFALAFLPMFGIGGLTGLPLGLAASDIPLHDTYYVVGHFHYIVAPGTLFALFAGIYYWFPKVTGRMMNDAARQAALLGIAHRHERDLPADVHPGARRRESAALRRRPDVQRSPRRSTQLYTRPVVVGGVSRRRRSCSSSSISSGACVRGARTAENPWEATTLEWTTTSPPPHDNFASPPTVVSRPVRLQPAGRGGDFSRRHQP